MQIGGPGRGCNSDARARADGHRQEWDVSAQCAFLLLWEFAGQLQISRKVENGAKSDKGMQKERGISVTAAVLKVGDERGRQQEKFH